MVVEVLVVHEFLLNNIITAYILWELSNTNLSVIINNNLHLLHEDKKDVNLSSLLKAETHFPPPNITYVRKDRCLQRVFSDKIQFSATVH